MINPRSGGLWPARVKEASVMLSRRSAKRALARCAEDGRSIPMFERGSFQQGDPSTSRQNANAFFAPLGMTRPGRALVVFLFLTLALTGCGFMKRSKSEFYALERIAPTQAVTAISGLPIGIDVVELPPGLDRREIVVRQQDQRLEIREKDQWSASFEPLVLHTLAFDLASRLPEGMVILPGQSKPINAMRSLDVVFEDLAPGPENSIEVHARWILRQTGQPDLTKTEQFMTPIDSLSSAAVATGMSRAIATLADRIAAQL
jgi:uncharacterized lipoprotein YmbA